MLEIDNKEEIIRSHSKLLFSCFILTRQEMERILQVSWAQLKAQEAATQLGNKLESKSFVLLKLSTPCL